MPEVTLAGIWKLAIVVASFFGAAIPLWLSVAAYRTGKRDKRFESYHKLIDDLVGKGEEVPYIDRQVAIIFELKRFREYYPLTLKLLSALRVKWEKANSQYPNMQRLIDEIDLTVAHIKRKV